MTATTTSTRTDGLAAAIERTHDSFKMPLGDMALAAHTRGEHARHRSLVCRACRDAQ